MDKDKYTLSEKELKCIRDFDAGLNQALRDLQMQRAGIFRAIAAVNDLRGDWSVSPDGTSLVRVQQSPTGA